MVANVQFFPLGNADTLRIDLATGGTVLIDYADMRCADDKKDLALRPSEGIAARSLEGRRRNDYDAVCITHLDDDHCNGFGEFFWLRHARAYQDDDRTRIGELLGAGGGYPRRWS